MTLPSGAERGRIFPLAGGRSAKSMYAPASMRSAIDFDMGGSPCPRKNCCGAGFSGTWLVAGGSDNSSAALGAMQDFYRANGYIGDRTRKVSGMLPVGLIGLDSGSMQCVEYV